MAVPAFLNTDFDYSENLNVTDVQTVIDDLYAFLVTGNGWTCTAGGVGQSPTTFKSPTRADGVGWTLTFTRTAATTLQFNSWDQWGISMGSDVMTINALGTEVRYFVGPFHWCVDFMRGGAAIGAFWGGVLDKTPDGVADLPVYICSYRALSTWSNVQGMGLQQGGYTGSEYVNGFFFPYRIPAAGASDHFISVSGALMFCQAEWIWNYTLMGRAHQMILVDDSQIVGTELTVPIDAGTTGTFRVICRSSAGGQMAAMRKA